MTNEEIINLIISSSNYNPYTGTLSIKENIMAAVELAKVFKDFADNGYTENSMGISSNRWSIIIDELNKFNYNKL